MEHLPPLAGVELNTTPSPSDSRRSLLESALKRSGWNVAGAAAELRVSRATMHRQMRALNLSRPKKQD
jgi:transcriptional regulator of acetoin/glycerol metabolism